MLKARHGYHPHELTWIVEKSRLHALIKEMVMLPGSQSTLVQWHLWRMLGAAHLKRLGALQSTLLALGGWHSVSLWQLHTKMPSEWKFHKGGPLPMPKLSDTGVPQWFDGEGTTSWLWSRAIRRELSKAPSVPPATCCGPTVGFAGEVILQEPHSNKRSGKNC